jgi:hypothetical protein
MMNEECSGLGEALSGTDTGNAKKLPEWQLYHWNGNSAGTRTGTDPRIKSAKVKLKNKAQVHAYQQICEATGIHSTWSVNGLSLSLGTTFPGLRAPVFPCIQPQFASAYAICHVLFYYILQNPRAGNLMPQSMLGQKRPPTI